MITVTRNDIYRFDEWVSYYQEYKDDISMHIIVDDASERDYVNKIKTVFSNSIVIERKVNGGSNAAVNDGLRCALQNENIDAIMVLDNDIQFVKGSIKKLYTYLFSDNDLGVVGPLVLKCNSDIVEDFGVNLTYFSSQFIYQGYSLKSIPKSKKLYVDIVPGGITMAKRTFYEKVGLQDESIFMYCDERDMSYRAKSAGYKLGVISDAVCWHQHKYCPPIGKRLKSVFLTERNKIYLIKKYKGILNALLNSLWTIIKSTIVLFIHPFSSQVRFNYKQTVLGVCNGICGRLINDDIWY